MARSSKIERCAIGNRYFETGVNEFHYWIIFNNWIEFFYLKRRVRGFCWRCWIWKIIYFVFPNRRNESHWRGWSLPFYGQNLRNTVDCNSGALDHARHSLIEYNIWSRIWYVKVSLSNSIFRIVARSSSISW